MHQHTFFKRFKPLSLAALSIWHKFCKYSLSFLPGISMPHDLPLTKGIEASSLWNTPEAECTLKYKRDCCIGHLWLLTVSNSLESGDSKSRCYIWFKSDFENLLPPLWEFITISHLVYCLFEIPTNSYRAAPIKDDSNVRCPFSNVDDFVYT